MPSALLAILTVLLVTIGVTAAYALRRRRPGPDVKPEGLEGIEAKDLPTPLVALAGLLVAFVLVTTFNDWKDARRAAAREARATEAELSILRAIPGAEARATEAALACYGRSVVALEWPSLGDRRQSPVTRRWAREVDRRYAALLASQAKEALVQAALDERLVRVGGRLDRLAAGQPSVPAALTALLIAAVVLGVGAIGYLAHPRIRPVLAVPVLAAIAVLFSGALLLIQDMDRPFSGPIAIPPGEMRDALALAPRGGLPCDAQGRPG